MKKNVRLIIITIIMAFSMICAVGCGESKILFNTLEVNGTDVYGVVSNSTESFSFLEEIKEEGKSKYFISLDEYGFYISATKIVPLNEGDNKFYIMEQIDDEVVNVYKVVIRRRPIYTVRFNTNGGTEIQNQNVEEGSLINTPNNPTKTAYDFVSWDYDFATPITKSITINAKWVETTYTISYDLAGGTNANKNPAEYTINSNITLEEPTRKGYNFLGWYDGSTKIESIKNSYGNKSLIAKWESQEFMFEYSNGTITGVKYKYRNVKDVVIPSKINGEPITTIGASVFSYFSSLRSVEIPQGITTIGNYCFTGCRALTSISIPEGVIKIGNSAFSYCASLKTIVLPTSLTTIGETAFKSCSALYSVTIGRNCQLTTINSCAFQDCKALREIRIPKSVTYIGGYVFDNCDLLTIYCDIPSQPSEWVKTWNSDNRPVVWA